MKTKAIYYHAGCPVCVNAEQGLANSLDPEKYELELVHLGEQSGRITEAESSGVESVPALVIGDNTYHINFGASINDLK